jgi:hypothetical protein
MPGFERARLFLCFACRLRSVLLLVTVFAVVGCEAPSANLEMIDLEARIAALEDGEFDPSALEGRIGDLESGLDALAPDPAAPTAESALVRANEAYTLAEGAQTGVEDLVLDLGEEVRPELIELDGRVGLLELDVSGLDGVVSGPTGLSIRVATLEVQASPLLGLPAEVIDLAGDLADLAADVSPLTGLPSQMAALASQISPLTGLPADVFDMEAELSDLAGLVDTLPTAGVEFLPERLNLAFGAPVAGSWVAMPLPAELLDAEAIYVEVEFQTIGGATGDDVLFSLRPSGANPPAPRTQRCIGTHVDPGQSGGDEHTCHMWVPLEGTGTVEYLLSRLNGATSIGFLTVKAVAQLTE